MNTRDNIIAFVTDDGSTISAHFGRAHYYEVVTLKDGLVSERRRLSKTGHHSFGHGEHGHDGQGHHQADKHASMTAPLAGVEALIARGMGLGAHQHLLASGIRPILTDLHTIDEAIQHFVDGGLQDNPQRLHDHGPHHDH
jgi:predicted Fe-Mo cluster-binding NifX family protein